MTALQGLENSLAGYRVTRLEHSLQSATHALNAGESEEMIVAALLHDIGDELAPASHSEMAAAILRPYVSERIYQVIKRLAGDVVTTDCPVQSDEHRVAWRVRVTSVDLSLPPG